MRSSGFPASCARSVLTIGIAAPAAATKFSAAPFVSASAARSTPCLASSALLAVTTDLPPASAASIAAFAGSPAPPISSTKTSMSVLRASATGSSNHLILLKSMPRSLPFDRAAALGGQQFALPGDLGQQGRADGSEPGNTDLQQL